MSEESETFLEIAGLMISMVGGFGIFYFAMTFTLPDQIRSFLFMTFGGVGVLCIKSGIAYRRKNA